MKTVHNLLREWFRLRNLGGRLLIPFTPLRSEVTDGVSAAKSTSQFLKK